MTKFSTLAAAAALALVAATSAQAETYEGVHPVAAGVRDSGAVQAEAYAAARDPKWNIPRGSRGAETVAVSGDRATVQAEAVRAAHAPDQNVTSGSRVNSKVISTLPNPIDVQAGAQQGNRL